MKDPSLAVEWRVVTFGPQPRRAANQPSGHAMRANVERELNDGFGWQERSPPNIPDHTLLERIGVGAYGDVWLARCALGTLRAVKIVYRSRFEDPRPYHREFNGILRYEPFSRTHDGLVAVLHAGRNDAAGCFYYVMELADNAKADPTGLWENSAYAPGTYCPKTLRSVVEKVKRFPTVEVAQMGVKLAGALAHLHAHGLVHRDIKPSNVIFVGGRPKLADLGLITGTGDSRSFVGTEGFIPPEGPGSARADVFSLGKLLYELATGRDRLEFPQLPAEVLRLPEREALLDLNEVLTKACAPDPAKRYATATELLADLNLFLSGRSLREARTLSQRLKWLTYCALGAIVLFVLACVALWVASNAATVARDKEEQSRARAAHETALRQRAQSAEKEARLQLYTALLEQARATLRSGESGQRLTALAAIQNAAAITNSPELRCAAFAALALPDLKPLRRLDLGAGVVVARLDSAFERLAISRGKGPVEILDPADGRLLVSLPASIEAPAYFASWSQDGSFLAVKRGESANRIHQLEVWAVSGPPRLVQVSSAVDYGVVSFHHRLPQLIGTADDGAVTIWSLDDAQATRRFDLSARPQLLCYSPEGERFATSFRTNGAWNLVTHRVADGERLTSRTLSHEVASIHWHPAGRLLAVVDHGSSVNLIDTVSGETQLVGRHKLQAVSAVFSPDGRYLFTGGWEREIACWDLWTRERAFTASLDGFSMQFSSDGKTCMVVSRDGLKFFSFETPRSCRAFADDLGGRIYRGTFSPDGRWLAVPGQTRLGLWDLNGAHAPAGVLLKAGADSRICFSKDNRRLFASRDDGCTVLELDSLTTKSTVPSLKQLNEAPPHSFASLCVGPNRTVLTSSLGSLSLNENGASAEDHVWHNTIMGVNAASPDGRFLTVFRPFTPLLYIYSLPNFESVVILTNLTNIRDVEFPSENQLMISSSSGIGVWDTASWQNNRHIRDFTGALLVPGRDLAWLTKDFRLAGLYRYSSLDLILPLPPGILPLAVSPDGRFLAASRDAQQLQLWDLLELEQELAQLGINLPD